MIIIDFSKCFDCQLHNLGTIIIIIIIIVNKSMSKLDKAVEYIISACPILAKEQHIKRHERERLLDYTLTYTREWA